MDQFLCKNHRQILFSIHSTCQLDGPTRDISADYQSQKTRHSRYCLHICKIVRVCRNNKRTLPYTRAVTSSFRIADASFYVILYKRWSFRSQYRFGADTCEIEFGPLNFCHSKNHDFLTINFQYNSKRTKLLISLKFKRGWLKDCRF